MNSTFSQRCQAALTHPVTLAAIAVLVVNDLALKALWPSPWTTGKLSDLAWVVFASPLLAFLLSLATPRNAYAERAVFAAAYIGLPLLYAAFNTLEPVHDWISSGLGLLAGRPTGGTPDPTDSLVIPLGLAAALWVWRRGAANQSDVRQRLVLLTAGFAAFASVASGPPPHELGVIDVGVGEDGVLVARSTDGHGGLVEPEGGRHYMSADGGFSWGDGEWVDREVTEAIAWGGQTAETPRGTYAVTRTGITLTGGGPSEAAYSTEFLGDPANRLQHEVATKRFSERMLRFFPRSIVYHQASGNVVATLGLQGVVVGDADGVWHRIAVGRFSPTDFSASGKLRTIFSRAAFWFTGLAVAASFTASALALARVAPNWALGRILFAIAAATAAIVALLLLFSTETSTPIGEGVLREPDILFTFGAVMMLLFSLWSALAVAASILPQRQYLLAAFVALLAMMALFAVSFLIAIAQEVRTAKLFALLLVFLAAVSFYVYLRRKLSEEQPALPEGGPPRG